MSYPTVRGDVTVDLDALRRLRELAAGPSTPEDREEVRPLLIGGIMALAERYTSGELGLPEPARSEALRRLRADLDLMEHDGLVEGLRVLDESSPRGTARMLRVTLLPDEKQRSLALARALRRSGGPRRWRRV